MKLMDITPYYHSTSGGIKTYINYKVEFVKNQDVEHVVVVPVKSPEPTRWEGLVFTSYPPLGSSVDTGFFLP
jgi:hypothetical protein